MAVAKDAPRKYRSPLRQEQAQRTRTAILDAATELFVAKGYGATTMKDIAAAAEVSVESVYAQGSKASLLQRCVDRSIVGDDEEVPLLERDDLRALMSTVGRDEKLAALRTVAAARLPGSAAIYEAFRAGAALDPGLTDAWQDYERRRHGDCGRMVAGFADELRPGLTLETATDIFWTLVSPPVIQMLVTRGWTAERYADWLVDSIRRQLLDGP